MAQNIRHFLQQACVENESIGNWKETLVNQVLYTRSKPTGPMDFDDTEDNNSQVNGNVLDIDDEENELIDLEELEQYTKFTEDDLIDLYGDTGEQYWLKIEHTYRRMKKAEYTEKEEK